MKKAFYYNYC